VLGKLKNANETIIAKFIFAGKSPKKYFSKKWDNNNKSHLHKL
jgi:hypothetical protein